MTSVLDDEVFSCDAQTHADRGGRTATFGYDNAGRLRTKDFEDGTQVKMDFTADNLSSSESYLGSTVTKNFDVRGRLKSINQDGQSVNYDWRNDNQLKTKTYGNMNLNYVYDPNNARLKSVADGTNSMTLTYDSNGRVANMSLPNSVSRGMTYDNAGRVASVTQNLAGETETQNYSYDAAGRVTGIRGVQNKSFVYDSAGRLSSERSSGQGSYTKSYTYDANDNRATMRVSGSASQNVLDFDGAVLPAEVSILSGSWTAQNNQAHAVADATGNAQILLMLPAHSESPYSVQLTPDVSSLQAGQSENAGITFSSGVNNYFASVKISCDASNHFSRSVLIENTATHSVLVQSTPVSYTNETLTLNVEYIANDQTVSVSVNDEDAIVTPVLSLPFSPGLKVSSETVTNATCDFDNFSYWIVANPSTNSYSYNAINQLTAISGGESSTFDYDVFGNMTAQTKDGLSTAFDYDRLNRQISAGTNTSTYYGASGLRKSSNGTSFIHDGNTCVVSGNTNYFVPGSTPLWETSGGQTLTYGTERGNVTALVGANGVQTKFKYDAFGNVKTFDTAQNSITANTSGPRYNGYFLDAGTTDQYATGYRPYRPDIGRFSSLDPAGSPNGPNRYNYCSSEPVNRMDPTGTIIRFPAPWGDYGPEQEGLITANSAVKQMVVNEMIRSPLIFTFNSVAAINALFEKRDRLARYHNLAMGFDASTPYLDGAIEGTQIVQKTAIVVGAVAATGGLAVSAGAAYTAGGATGLVVFGAETAVTVKAAGLVNEGAQGGLRAAGVPEDFVAPVADVVTAGVMAVPVKRLLTPKTNSSAAPTRSRSPMEPAEEGGNLNDYGKPSAPTARAEQPRSADGKFANKTGGEASPGSNAENATWDAIDQKPGWSLIRERVSTRDSTGQLRVYDGVATSPGNRDIGLEIKSGTASKTPAQRAFDQRVNSGTDTAVGVGKNFGLKIRRAVEIKVDNE